MFATKKTAFIFLVTLLCAAGQAAAGGLSSAVDTSLINTAAAESVPVDTALIDTAAAATANAVGIDTVVWGSPSSHPPGPRNVPRVSRQGSAQIETLEMNTFECGCSVLRGKHRHFPKLRMSAGAGLCFDGDFGGGITWNASRERVRMPYYGGGPYLFFDAEYAEFSIGFSSGGWEWKSGDVPADDLPLMARSFFTVGALAKYPVNIGQLSAYPMLGVNYTASRSARLKMAGGDDYVFDGGEEYGPGGGRRPRRGDLSALWAMFGVGAEKRFGAGINVRSELLYGIRGANTFEKERVGAENNKGLDARAARGHGLILRVGVGVDIQAVKTLGQMTSM